MEALTAVNLVLLTINDRCKAVDRWMVMNAIRLLEKQDGASGHWRRDDNLGHLLDSAAPIVRSRLWAGCANEDQRIAGLQK
jgi:hypothetical protein